jgi:TolB-like protein
MNREAIDEKLIQEELDRILSTKSISSSPILSKFLRFVVTETLAGRDHLIKEYTIGVEVLGRDGQFMSHSDASVRIHAIRLRKVLDEYYDLKGPEATIRIEIPKGQYKPVFSYVSNTSQHLKNYYEAEVIPEDSICIVPFQGFINNKSFDFSTLGFCQYLSEKLSLFQDISVFSFGSISHYIEEGGEIQKLGEQFGITYYLTGSMEIDEHSMVVSVQLYDSKTNDLIWSHDFSSKLVDTSLMTVVENITSKIVSSLAGYSGYIHYKMFNHSSHLPEIPNKMANAVFWFYRFQAQHSEQVFFEAVSQLEKVVHESPACALCYAVLAHLYADEVMFSYQTVPDPMGLAQHYIDKALALDPNCQQAHVTQSWIYLMTGRKDEAFESVKKSYSLNPNSSYVVSGCSFGYVLLGDYETAQQLYEKAIMLNPLPYWWLNLVKVLSSMKKGNFQEALFHARKKGTPKMVYEYVFEMIACVHLGDERSLKEYLHLHRQKFPGKLEQVSRALSRVIHDPEMKDLLAEAFDHIKRVELPSL